MFELYLVVISTKLVQTTLYVQYTIYFKILQYFKRTRLVRNYIHLIVNTSC